MRGPKPHRLLQAIPEKCHSTGDWNRTNGLLVQSEVQRPTTATPASFKLAKHSVRELNPIYELQRLASRLRAGESFQNKRVSLGSRTHLAGLEVRNLCLSAKDTERNLEVGRQSVKFSNVQLLTSNFRKAPAEGLEPSIVSLTGSRLTIGPHRILQSAQWESNPHFRHGKAAGYRYIMGAKLHRNQIVKDHGCIRHPRAPSRNRTRITSLRRRSLAVRPSVLVVCFSGTGENRTHMVRFKRTMHYLVCHNPKFSCRRYFF